MSSFNEAIKGLQRSFARQAINADLQQSGSLIDPLKYTKRKPARALGYVNYTFSLDLSAVNLNIPNDNISYISFQFNLTAPTSFRILNAMQLQNALNLNGGLPFVVCIRYRQGTTAYRYSLNDATAINLDVPVYTNQLILPNFVIEFWKLSTTFGAVQLNGAIPFTTSQISLPATSDQTSVNWDLQPTLVSAALYAALNPEALPTVYDAAGSWLDNV